MDETTRAPGPATIERARETNELIEDLRPPKAYRAVLPGMMHSVLPLIALGLAVLVAGLALGIVGANWVNDGLAGDTEAMTDARVLEAWLPSMGFLGVGLILFGIGIALLGIAAGVRSMAGNVAGAILDHEGN